METAPLEALLELSRAAAATSRELDGHGLSFSELRLLRAVAAAAEGRTRPGDLAAELCVTASGVTRAILPLEKRHIVARTPDGRDGRASLVSLTPSGAELLAEAEATAAHTAQRLLRRLSLGQTRQLQRLLGDIPPGGANRGGSAKES
ncbi:MAG: MarR family winged helix-turn-helix transcriptional regulator [Vulcanimicrobiaceae bacterium]